MPGKIKRSKMQNKKKLLFVCNNLHVGGIQRSLVNLLGEISDKYDVTLFLFYPSGEYEIPPGVRLISGNKFTRIMGMSQSEADMEGTTAKLWRSTWTVLTRAVGCKIPFGLLCRFQKIHGEFDAAISFMQNSAFRYFYGGCNEFTVKSVSAKRKISFVHCDFEHYFGNNKYNREYYKNFDAIACVSESCKNVFGRACPELVHKTVAVHNCFNYEEMHKAADEFLAEHTEGKINIFTSARISEEKGIFRAIRILGSLKNKGYDFVWRIAGSGALYEKAVAKCKNSGLEENIIFLGLLKNPYPYFKTADLLLVPSYDEAAPMVYGEAEAFGTPILTTDTVSARELVSDKGIGLVCENSESGIERALERLLKNPKELYGMRYLPHGDNSRAVSEFDNIILG